MNHEERTYQRIGEFAVCFQWIENKLREIGWFILDPERAQWPPTALRNLTNEKLVDRVHALFIDALPKCRLDVELQTDFKDSFVWAAVTMHKLRHARNRMLHSAFIELKAGGEVVGMLRSDPKLEVDEDGSPLLDQEMLHDKSLAADMHAIAEMALFLNRAYAQLIHRYPNGGPEAQEPPPT